MTYSAAVARAALAASFLLLPAAPASPMAGQGSTSNVRCLPPGGSTPIACTTASAGSVILVPAKPQARPEPVTLFFREITQRRKNLVATVVVPDGSRYRDGSYQVVVPPLHCSADRANRQFQIERLMRGLGIREPLGVITVTC